LGQFHGNDPAILRQTLRLKDWLVSQVMSEQPVKCAFAGFSPDARAVASSKFKVQG
jgi:hypothetical protein